MSTDRIRELNDSFRLNPFGGGGRVMVTSGVMALGVDLGAAALLEVAKYKDFNADNDPHGEHDFGAFEFKGHKFFWKLDYFDKAMEFGSPDPSNPEVTTRVLTLMLREEY